MPGLDPGIHLKGLAASKTWMAGHRRAKATPSFRRLCPAMTAEKIGGSLTEPNSAPHRLQALEGQALGILDPGQIEPADEGNDRVAVAIGQRNDGINGNTLGVHGLPRSDSSLKPPSVEHTG